MSGVGTPAGASRFRESQPVRQHRLLWVVVAVLAVIVVFRVVGVILDRATPTS